MHFFFCAECEKCAKVLHVGWPSTSELYCTWIRNYYSMLVCISLEIGTFMQNGYHVQLMSGVDNLPDMNLVINGLAHHHLIIAGTGQVEGEIS